jgi:hypothetical protein
MQRSCLIALLVGLSFIVHLRSVCADEPGQAASKPMPSSAPISPHPPSSQPSQPIAKPKAAPNPPKPNPAPSLEQPRQELPPPVQVITASEERFGAFRQKGVIELGGSALIQGAFAIATGSTSSGFSFALRPTLGYFVIDGLEIGGSLSIGGQFGSAHNNSYSVGAQIGMRYVFGTGTRVMPFLALYGVTEIGIADSSATVAAGVLDFATGILLAISEHVALSFGLEVLAVFVATPTSGTVIRLPAGFFGITTAL